MDDMMTNDMHEDDELLKELFQRSESQPGDDLKQKIMQEITVKKEVFEYQPVISKRVWRVLGSSFAALMVFLFNYNRHDGLTIINKENFINLFDWDIPSGLFNGWFEIHLDQIPSSFFVALIAFIVVGLYLIVSMSFDNRSLSNN